MVRRKSVKQLLQAVSIDTDIDVEVGHLSTDSRTVTKDTLFMAFAGEKSDGRDYMQEAAARGAVAIFYEATGVNTSPDIDAPCFAIFHLRQQIGIIAARFYDAPSRDLQVFAVTGTNGKTTSVYLLAQAFTLLGLHSGMIGTLGYGELNNLTESDLTTPDAITLQEVLAQCRDQGITQVCMEVSSHGLAQGRLDGTHIHTAIFTNLSQDHLDFHQNMKAYAQAKKRLFTDFGSELSIINAADTLGQELLQDTVSTYVSSYGEGGDVSLISHQADLDGLTLEVQAQELEFSLRSQLIGELNIENLLMLAATLLALGNDVNEIQRIVADIKPAPGRMELYSKDGMPHVIVDYAHTPDALSLALQSIRQHCRGELWCVFGCGGDRDQEKRPLMGEMADRYSDQIIVTNDNPRSENPDTIAEQILQGIDGKVSIQLDRAKAIARALKEADQDDWVLVAGKGHEEKQQIGDRYRPFSDRQQVEAALGLSA